MKNIKNLSDLEINELQTLICKMQDNINDFMHVSDNLPASIKNTLTSFYLKLNNEADYRENQIYKP